jgi:hypothetical protein
VDVVKKKIQDNDDLRPEYPAELFTNMEPNRFAGTDLHYKRSVILDAAGTKSAKTPTKRRAS